METHPIVFPEKMMILQMKLEQFLDLVKQKLDQKGNYFWLMWHQSAMKPAWNNIVIIWQICPAMEVAILVRLMPFAQQFLMVLMMQCSALLEFSMRMRIGQMNLELYSPEKHVKVIVEGLLKLIMKREGRLWLELHQVNITF